MTLHSLFSQFCHFLISRRVAAALVALCTLAWSSPAFCGEIHEAAKNGDLEKLKTLLKSNASLVSSKDSLGRTPLHWAASEGHKDVADLLLAHKADVNAKENYGFTPLQEAAENGHKGIAELLLTDKADVNAKNQLGWTALHYAAREGHKDIVELLLANKAEVNAKNNNGETPLHWAVSQGHKDVAELLRQHGGRQERTATTPQHRAFLGGAISIGGDISAIETKFFSCTPVFPFKKGDKVAAMLSEDQAWSVDMHSLQVGTEQVSYPILAMVKASDGFHSLFPAILMMKIDIKVGETLRADGYRIVAQRAVRAGQSILVLRIGDSFLSVEAAALATDKGKAEPSFTAYKDDIKANGIAALIEAWRAENEHIRK